jgi:hypothetical protein
MLTLRFYQLPSYLNFDDRLDSICALRHLEQLSLRWNRMSIEMIMSSLNKQGKKKKLQTFCLRGLDRAINEAEILEICSYLTDLRDWSVDGSGSTLTVDGVREWKRICPKLEKVVVQRNVLSNRLRKCFKYWGLVWVFGFEVIEKFA